MEIYLVRHGETDWNQYKKVQGPTSSQLTAGGVSQARKIKEYFSDNKIVFDVVYFSPTTRTKQTLDEIKPSVIEGDYISTTEIQERHHVDLVGLNKSEIEEKFEIVINQRLSWELYFEGTEKSVLTNRFSNNETLEEVKGRVRAFIETLSVQSKGAKVLIVGHSVCNQYLLEHFKFETVGENQFDNFQKNNEIRIVTLDDEGGFVNLSKIFL